MPSFDSPKEFEHSCFFRIYLFSVMTLASFIPGEWPHLEETGPYVPLFGKVFDFPMKYEHLYFLFRIYLFSVMNPEAVTTGERPHLEEIGPYVYRNMLFLPLLVVDFLLVFNSFPSIASKGFFTTHTYPIMFWLFFE